MSRDPALVDSTTTGWFGEANVNWLEGQSYSVSCLANIAEALNRVLLASKRQLVLLFVYLM